MGKAPGSAKTGGRVKGSTNRTSSEIREAIQKIVAGRIDKAPAWIDKVALTNPAKALEILIKLTELVVSKPVSTPEIEEQKEGFIERETKRLFEMKAS